MRPRPWVACERLADRCLRRRLDGVDGPIVRERPAEHDEAVAHEPVHERRVGVPARLAFERQRVVVVRPGTAEGHEEHRHGSVVTDSVGP